MAGSNEWLTLKLRHKRPDGDTSVKQESVVTGDPVRWQDADSNFRFATAVALFGMKLRGMSEVADITWNRVREIAGPAGDDDRAEFLELVRTLGGRER